MRLNAIGKIGIHSTSVKHNRHVYLYFLRQPTDECVNWLFVCCICVTCDPFSDWVNKHTLSTGEYDFHDVNDREHLQNDDVGGNDDDSGKYACWTMKIEDSLWKHSTVAATVSLR